MTMHRSGWALVAILVAIVAASGATAVHSAGFLELDGGVVDAPGGVPHDWDALFDAAGDPIAVGGDLVFSTFDADASTPDRSYHDSSDKDGDDTTAWQCGDVNNPTPKNEILNAYAAYFRTDVGAPFLYFGFERATNNGNSFMGFWFLQGETGCTAIADGGDGNFTGGHAVGDLLVLSDFTGGGTLSTIQVFRWDPTVPGNLDLVFTGADCQTSDPSDAACGRVNSAALTTPWPPGSATALPTNTFFEGGIDLGSLFGAELPCFTTVLAETRTSQSTTAQLKDYAGGTFKTCDARISIGPESADNPVGTTHEMTVLVETDVDGDGTFEPAVGVLVTGTITGGPGEFVGGNTCTTGEDGTCTLTITSIKSGTTTVEASADVLVGATTLHRTTDGDDGSSGPAGKTWHPVASTTVTTPSSATIVLGGAVNDTAFVSGDLGPLGGTVSFFVCAPSETSGDPPACPTGGSPIGSQPVNSDGVAVSADFTPSAAGTWCFRAEYSGDATYLPSSDGLPSECFEVTQATPVIATASDPTGDVAGAASASDVATVSGPGAVPTGSVAFYLCGPSDVTVEGCPSGGAAVGSVDLVAGAATSPVADGPFGLGKHCWRAEYSGDASYFPASHTDASLECFTVLTPISSLDKAVRLLPDGEFGPSTTAAPGSLVEFRLTYSNDGNSDATGVVVTDPLPEHTAFDSCDPPTCTVDAGIVSFALGTVEAGGSREVTFVVVLEGAFDEAETTIENVATVDTDEEDPSDSPPVTIVVPAAPDLHLVKTTDDAAATVGGAVTFNIAYWNEGDENVASATITDTIPAGTTFASCTGGCAESGGVVTWAVAVPAHTSALQPAGNVSLTVVVEELLGCEVCNTATIASAEQDGGAVADESTACLDMVTDASGAASAGAAYAARTGFELVDELVPKADSYQDGPGAADETVTGPGVFLPSQLRIATFTASSASTVTSSIAHQVSISEVTNVDVLGGLVVAEKVRSYAETHAAGASAGYTASGAWFDGLFVDGAPVANVAPNTRIDLGGGAYVMLREEIGAAQVPGGLSGGETSSDLMVNMIRVHVAGIDIVVAQAVAHAEFPRAISCDPDPEADVDADAVVYRA
ncbi:MAG TPA: choice-of-anchor P family protein, partial [Candidatus Thermoplasmatota archaeon]|nr:choice-of-anchor P family protein [Candidatus Thermoplasmatota archaeon]